VAEGLVRRTQYWNLPTHTVRAGATGHGESLVDLEGYLLPLADARTAALHLWGVAEGLEVSAVVGSGEVTVAAGVTVCWLVTGVRQDPWANAHRIVPEAPKPESEVERFVHPELYGAGLEQGLFSQPVAGSDESME
jgi:hypothetical protein